MNDTITIKEMAEGLNLSVGYAYQVWPEWIRFGVNPSRPSGKKRGGLRFSRSDIAKVKNGTKVVAN